MGRVSLRVIDPTTHQERTISAPFDEDNNGADVSADERRDALAAIGARIAALYPNGVQVVEGADIVINEEHDWWGNATAHEPAAALSRNPGVRLLAPSPAGGISPPPPAGPRMENGVLVLGDLSTVPDGQLGNQLHLRTCAFLARELVRRHTSGDPPQLNRQALFAELSAMPDGATQAVRYQDASGQHDVVRGNIKNGIREALRTMGIQEQASPPPPPPQPAWTIWNHGGNQFYRLGEGASARWARRSLAHPDQVKILENGRLRDATAADGVPSLSTGVPVMPTSIHIPGALAGVTHRTIRPRQTRGLTGGFIRD